MITINLEPSVALNRDPDPLWEWSCPLSEHYSVATWDYSRKTFRDESDVNALLVKAVDHLVRLHAVEVMDIHVSFGILILQNYPVAFEQRRFK